MTYKIKELRTLEGDIHKKIYAAVDALRSDLEEEIVGKNGETIDNATNGYWNFGTGKVIGTGNFGSGAGMSTPLLNTAFGSPTTVGGGFRAVYRDTSGNKTYHVCVCTGIDGWFAYEASPVAGS